MRSERKLVVYVKNEEMAPLEVIDRAIFRVSVMQESLEQLFCITCSLSRFF